MEWTPGNSTGADGMRTVTLNKTQECFQQGIKRVSNVSGSLVTVGQDGGILPHPADGLEQGGAVLCIVKRLLL